MEDIIAKIKDEKPLIHHITNYVTINDSANITLYWGGLPVMADSKKEVVEMVESASALVLNIGMLNKGQVEAMLKAGKRANQLGIPIILDPVGAGATEFRTNATLELIEQLELTAIKGNAGEITILAGKKAEVKGVEAIGEYQDVIANAEQLASKESTIVVVSGAKDIVTNGKSTYQVENGHSLMGQIVGTGCMLSSTLGVFCGVDSDDDLITILQAVAAYGIAGEKASEETVKPASYKIAFLDNISEINDFNLNKEQKIEKL